MADGMIKIRVLVPGAREKFESWIATRGGVQVWNNVNLSDPGAGQVFTPALEEVKVPEENGGINMVPYHKPRWTHERGEVVTDINRFEFVKAWKEIKRFRVALRMGSQGTMIKLTDGSSAKVRKFEESHPGAYYRFDYETQECVFEMPEME